MPASFTTPVTVFPRHGVMEKLVSVLTSDLQFSSAVQRRDPHATALAVVRVLVVRALSSQAALLVNSCKVQLENQPSLQTTRVTTTSSEVLHGCYSAAERTANVAQTSDLCVGSRVVIQPGQKRTPPALIGTTAEVLHLAGNGWVTLSTASGQELKIQQRYLVRVSDLGRAQALEAFTNCSRVAKGQIAGRIAMQLPLSLCGTAGYSQEATLDRALTCTVLLRRVSERVLLCEEKVPWQCVKHWWRSRRNNWRRAMRQPDGVADLAHKLLEFKMALDDEGSRFVDCGPMWDSRLEDCARGAGSDTSLCSLWNDLHQRIHAWLETRLRQPVMVDSPPASLRRGLHLLQNAVWRGPDFLTQVPLEAVINHDVYSLKAVRVALECRKGILTSSRPDKFSGEGSQPCPYCTTQQEELCTCELGEESDNSTDLTNMSDSD